MQLSNKHFNGSLCTAVCTISNIDTPIQMDLEKDSATEDEIANSVSGSAFYRFSYCLFTF